MEHRDLARFMMGKHNLACLVPWQSFNSLVCNSSEICWLYFFFLILCVSNRLHLAIPSHLATALLLQLGVLTTDKPAHNGSFHSNNQCHRCLPWLGTAVHAIQLNKAVPSASSHKLGFSWMSRSQCFLFLKTFTKICSAHLIAIFVSTSRHLNKMEISKHVSTHKPKLSHLRMIAHNLAQGHTIINFSWAIIAALKIYLKPEREHVCVLCCRQWCVLNDWNGGTRDIISELSIEYNTEAGAFELFDVNRLMKYVQRAGVSHDVCVWCQPWCMHDVSHGVSDVSHCWPWQREVTKYWSDWPDNWHWQTHLTSWNKKKKKKKRTESTWRIETSGDEASYWHIWHSLMGDESAMMHWHRIV